MNKGICKSCKRPIVWVTTEAGKAMPLDPDPVADGNIVFIGPDTVRVLGAGSTAKLAPRFKSHFASCPFALDSETRTALQESFRQLSVPGSTAKLAPRFKSHFASCPFAAVHRKERS